MTPDITRRAFLGMVVAVRRVGLTEEQKTRLALADNRANELSAWDVDRIREFEAAGVELDRFFDVEELEALLGEAPEGDGPRPGAKHTDRDVAPEMRPTAIRPGQIFALGRHRLVCGDCRDPELAAKLIAGATPLIVSDPPYCSGSFQEAGKGAGTWGDIASENLSTRGFQTLITKTLEAWRPQSVYFFTDWKMWIPLYDLVEGAGLPIRSMIVWNKGTPGLGAVWRTQHELVQFATRARNAKRPGVGTRGNVIDIPALDAQERQAEDVSAVVGAGRTGNHLHYTEKPVDLLDVILANDEATARGACVVVDPFAGSGTTLIAADGRDRTCIAVEVEPKFCQVVIDRWEALTGGKAEKLDARRVTPLTEAES
ncbi:MAG: DNA modification methylase [Vicinamibacterales bacterium]